MILGIQLDFPHIRTCLLKKGRQGIEIVSLKIIPIMNDSNLYQQYDSLKSGAPFEGYEKIVKQLYIEKFKGRIVSGLSANQFLVRSLELKIAGGRHIEEAIAFQSEALSHFKPEEVLNIPVIQKKDKEKADILLFTVPRSNLKEHLTTLSSLQIDPDAVTTVPSALCQFVKWKLPKLIDAFIVDLGSHEITCALMEEGKLKKSHPISYGIEQLLNALHQDRKKILLKKEIEGAARQIDLLILKPALNPHLSEQLTKLRQELAKIHHSFIKGSSRAVIFTGRTDAFIHLQEFLADFSKEKWPLSNEDQKFAVSIGLALDQASKHPIQLRRDEFFPQKNWSRMGFYAILLFFASIVLSGSLMSLGISSISFRKQTMLNSLQSSPRKKIQPLGNVEDQVDQWISDIETNNKEYPYILQAPKVAEVLSWLSTHLLLEQFKKEGDPMDIREVKYQLVSFPSISSSKDPFSVKIELEFSLKSMMNARKFHEALRKGDDWVNPNLEVAWEALSSSYRTSFYLKNREPYVP